MTNERPLREAMAIIHAVDSIVAVAAPKGRLAKVQSRPSGELARFSCGSRNSAMSPLKSESPRS
jgi:hypothetical protein